ncbi:type III-B CRISPR module-associated protein Cmr3 [Gemmata sp. JC673]|uniref:Type III-B CRISPR module-associated protein Cmr3 n=1 Tax=Gemmata algarum TaxID=2975278 RepID=A0ABU5F5Z4_9BACT|nr:type III-B CRISPR module-associated protein Cmr3 [Gemmata algarum]MDY3562990.1 type III-B CRISPR module-associated protein Cmr3 [Gemmata algarum]
MDASLNWAGLRLDPLDTLFFRDGRPFDAPNRVAGGLPTPQTLAGAIRTALLARTGFNFAEFARRRKDDPLRLRAALNDSGPPECQPVFDANFRGPWLALAGGDGKVEPLLPMPETLKRAKGDESRRSDARWSVAKPDKAVPGWQSPCGLRPLWRKVPADPKADAEWLTLTGLKKFLTGNPEAIAPGTECVKRDELVAADHRIGIVIDRETLTSADGQLYAISLLALKPRRKDGSEVCLYAELHIPDTLAALLDGALVPFGGEGKYVRVTKVREQDWPKYDSSAKHSMWYLATPTFFAPDGPPLPKLGDQLIAAASGAGVPVSGWDVARNCPRPTRFAVPAGAMYFVDGPVDPNHFLSTTDNAESDTLRQEGWGYALPGHWEGLN